MTTGELVDVTGALLVEIREYMASEGATDLTARGQAALAVGDAVYGGSKAEDRGAPYVILRRTGPSRRAPRAPIARFRYTAMAVGRTEQEATRVLGLVSDALHGRGPRRRNAGVAIYLSTEELGGQATLDPDTSEPVETAIFFVSVPLAQA